MSTLAIALAKIALLEARVDALEGGGARTSSNGGSGGGDGVHVAAPLPDHMLDNAWANAKIDKDPKGYKGPSQVNRTYSRAPVEWLTKAAQNLEYKAKCERAAVPVALQERGKNAGKPWHEATMFKAALLRAWALRNAGKTTAAAHSNGAAPSAPMAADDFDFGSNTAATDDSEIPF